MCCKLFFLYINNPDVYGLNFPIHQNSAYDRHENENGNGTRKRNILRARICEFSYNSKTKQPGPGYVNFPFNRILTRRFGKGLVQEYNQYRCDFVVFFCKFRSSVLYIKFRPGYIKYLANSHSLVKLTRILSYASFTKGDQHLLVSYLYVNVSLDFIEIW